MIDKIDLVHVNLLEFSDIKSLLKIQSVNRIIAKRTYELQHL